MQAAPKTAEHIRRCGELGLCECAPTALPWHAAAAAVVLPSAQALSCATAMPAVQSKPPACLPLPPLKQPDNTNHFFRVDKGFVAQTADIPGGRIAPLSPLQREVAERHVPLEVHPDVKHDKRGILSMARHDGALEGSGAVCGGGRRRASMLAR